MSVVVHRNSTDDLLLLQISSGVVKQTKDLQLSHSILHMLSPRICFIIVVNHDLFVNRDELLTIGGLSCQRDNQQNAVYHSEIEGEGN